MVGCVYIYGFGVMGQVGVIKVFEIIYKEMDVLMVFCGEWDIKNVSKDMLLVFSDFEGNWV